MLRSYKNFPHTALESYARSLPNRFHRPELYKPKPDYLGIFLSSTNFTPSISTSVTFPLLRS